jgi:hypothetical protein
VAPREERAHEWAEARAVPRHTEAVPDEALDQWLHVVALVYRYSDGEPYEIGATVLDACEIGPGGRAAVVTTLWPTR